MTDKNEKKPELEHTGILRRRIVEEYEVPGGGDRCPDQPENAESNPAESPSRRPRR